MTDAWLMEWFGDGSHLPFDFGKDLEECPEDETELEDDDPF